MGKDGRLFNLEGTGWAVKSVKYTRGVCIAIRDCIQNTLNPIGVAVVIECQHLCMQMRGVNKQNSLTTTSAFSGAFLNDDKSRKEFIHLIANKLK